MISYKYNIYRSKKTKYLDKMLRECCFVWNHALALQRRYYKLFGKYISIGKMKKHFAKRIKRIFFILKQHKKYLNVLMNLTTVSLKENQRDHLSLKDQIVSTLLFLNKEDLL